MHYKPKQISEVSSNDSLVSLVGKVIKTNDNSFILDDGTGKIEIVSDFQVEENKKVRVFCSINNETLKSDVVQDMEGLDMVLFKKVKELYYKTGV